MDVVGDKYVLGLSPQGVRLLTKIDSAEGLERISALEKDVSGGRPFLWYLESFMAKRLGKGESAGVEE